MTERHAMNAFIALSRVPETDVKILATTLALGILIDATIVRSVLAPALVAALGTTDWWTPHRRHPHTEHRAPTRPHAAQDRRSGAGRRTPSQLTIPSGQPPGDGRSTGRP